MSKAPNEPSDEVLDVIRSFTVDCSAGIVHNKFGREIFTNARDGYHMMNVKGRPTKRTHVVWFAHYGEWPAQMIDHIDRNRANDSITNLRLSTYSDNAINCHRSDRELPAGVYEEKRMKTRPYKAYYKGKPLGYFSTPEEASEAYQQHRGEV